MTTFKKKIKKRTKGKIGKIGLFYKVPRGAESSDRFPF